MVLPSARGFIATKAQRHKGLFLRNNMGSTGCISFIAAVSFVLEGLEAFKGLTFESFNVDGGRLKGWIVKGFKG